MTTKFEDFQKYFDTKKIKQLVRSDTVLTDVLKYLSDNDLTVGEITDVFKREYEASGKKNFDKLTGKPVKFARALDDVLEAVVVEKTLTAEQKKKFEDALQNYYQVPKPINTDKNIEKYKEALGKPEDIKLSVAEAKAQAKTGTRGGETEESKLAKKREEDLKKIVKTGMEVNADGTVLLKLDADEKMLEKKKEKDEKSDDKDLDIDLDEVERRKAEAKEKEDDEITVMDADEQGNPMPPDTAEEATTTPAPAPQATPATPATPAPPAPERMQDPVVRSLGKSQSAPTMADLIPKERLTTDFKDVSALMKDINYFFETFPEPLKQIKKEFDKLTPQKKANLMVLQRIHGRIVGMLQPEGSKEPLGKVGIVVDAEQYIEMKIREMIVSNRFANLTPAEVINVNEGVDSDKQKAKDYGNFEVEPATMGGKLYIQREPVYKAIPSNKGDDTKPAYAMRKSQPKRFGVQVAKQINLAKTAISFNNRNPFSQPVDTIKLRVIR